MAVIPTNAAQGRIRLSGISRIGQWYNNLTYIFNAMPLDTLKGSFDRALRTHFPCMLGIITHESRTAVYLEWDTSTLHEPPFEGTQSTVDDNTLRSLASAHDSSLKPTVATHAFSVHTQDIPQFFAKVTCGEHICVVVIALNHMVADMATAQYVMEAWAFEHRRLVSGTSESWARNPVFKDLSGRRSEAVVEPDYFRYTTLDAAGLRALGNTWGIVEQRVFVSPDAQDAMRRRARTVGVTFNSLLCAATWRAFARLYPGSVSTFNSSVDVRGRIGASTEMAGSLVLNSRSEIADIERMSVAGVAQVIQQSLERVDPGYMWEAMERCEEMWKRAEDNETVMFEYRLSRMPALLVTSYTNSGVFDLDFGCAIVGFVPGQMNAEGIAAICPRDANGIIEVRIALKEDADVGAFEAEVLRGGMRE